MEERIDVVERIAMAANSNSITALARVDGQEKLVEERIRGVYNEVKNVSDRIESVGANLKVMNKEQAINRREDRAVMTRITHGIILLLISGVVGLVLLVYENLQKAVG